MSCERVHQINYCSSFKVGVGGVCGGVHTKTFCALETKKALVDNCCWTPPPETEHSRSLLSLSLTHSPRLSLHLPHAGRAAENSDCTVVRHRTTLTRRYNKASLFPRGRAVERRAHGDRGRREMEAAAFIYTITFLSAIIRPRRRGLWESGRGGRSGARSIWWVHLTRDSLLWTSTSTHTCRSWENTGADCWTRHFSLCSWHAGFSPSPRPRQVLHWRLQ